jgi:hypothetical protein
MKNKLMLVLMLGIVLTSLVSAGLGTFKSGDCVDIKTILNTTDVTISSLSYPNSTNALGITNMDKNGLTFNYTFCDTSTIGTYYYDYNDSEGNVYVNDFEITPSGFVGTLGFYIIILILSLGFIILGYSIEDAWVVVLGAMGFILFGLFVLLYGVVGIKDSAYTYGFGIITIMLGAYFGIRGALEKMNEGL